MREILFRGKTDKGEWVQGQLLHFKASVGIGEPAIIIESCEWDNSNKWFNLGKRAKVIPETIGQYTGLTDKNGTKIFEGDIVKYGYTINKVVFEHRNDTAYFGVAMDDAETWHFCYLTNAACMEVIGNIHDNPELLGGAE